MHAYLLLSQYLAPLDVVDRIRPAHRDWLRQRQEAGELVLAGRRLSRTGSVVIVLAGSPEEAARLASLDPYVTQGVARYEIIPFEAARWGVEPPPAAAPPGSAPEMVAPNGI